MLRFLTAREARVLSGPLTALTATPRSRVTRAIRALASFVRTAPRAHHRIGNDAMTPARGGGRVLATTAIAWSASITLLLAVQRGREPRVTALGVEE